MSAPLVNARLTIVDDRVVSAGETTIVSAVLDQLPIVRALAGKLTSGETEVRGISPGYLALGEQPANAADDRANVVNVVIDESRNYWPSNTARIRTSGGEIIADNGGNAAADLIGFRGGSFHTLDGAGASSTHSPSGFTFALSGYNVSLGTTGMFFGGQKVCGPRRPDVADTSGATVGQLETSVNDLKQMLRDMGTMG